MEDTLYTIVYMKNNLSDNKYDFEYIPYYVVEGRGKDNFVDKDGNGFRNLDDKEVINSNCEFCVGKKYSLEDLKSMYGDFSIDELMVKLLNNDRKVKHFGINTDNRLELVTSSDFSIGIKDDNNYIFDNINLDKYSIDIIDKYNKIKKMKNNDDYVLLNFDDYINITKLDSKGELFNYFKYKMNNIDSFFETNFNRLVVISLKYLSSMLSGMNIESFKDSLKMRFDYIKEKNNSSNSSSSPMIDDYEDEEEDNDENDFKFMLDDLIDFLDVYKKLFDDVRSIKPFTEDKISIVKNYILEILDDISSILIGFDESYEEDDRFSDLLNYLSSYEELLDNLLQSCNDLSIKEKFLELNNDFIEKFESSISNITEEKTINNTKENITVDEFNALIDETLKKFDNLVGLNNVKQEVLKLLLSILLKLKLKDKIDFGKTNKHLAFLGNPGTGKTTVSDILSSVLHKAGYLDSDKVAKVAAQDLVAGYVGQTALKTEKLIKKNKGGIIIIDEAYILANGSDNGNDYGNEAITVILKEMEKNETMFVFCGYKKEMQEFFKMNSGLKSRIGNYIDFNDYTVDELFQIFMNKLNNCSISEYKLSITDDACEVIRKVIEKAIKIKDFGNARFIDNLFNNIVNQHSINTRYDCSLDRLLTFTIEDIDEKLIYNILGIPMEEENPLGFSSSNSKNYLIKK